MKKVLIGGLCILGAIAFSYLSYAQIFNQTGALMGGPVKFATLTASPPTITSGSSATLSWNSNQPSCVSPGSLNNTAIPGFSGAGNGTVSVSPAATTTYSIQCGTAPSAATVTVTPVTGGIACDIGPNFIGAIPAGAQLAGFTHCAANYDFTQNVTFNNGTGGTGYNLQNIATWLYCEDGAKPAFPLWWNTGYSYSPNPCARYSIVNDTTLNANVLLQTYTAADASNDSMTWMNSFNKLHNVSQGSFWPQGAYVEIVTRSDQASQNNSDHTPNARQIFSFFSYQPTPLPSFFMEWDIFEAWQDGGASGNFQIADANGHGGGGYVFWPGNGTNYAPSQEAAWHTYGKLMMNDGGSVFKACAYKDNVSIGCDVRTLAGAPAVSSQHNLYGMGVGAQDAVKPIQVPLGDEHMFTARATFFTCPSAGANWQTQNCVTSPFP